MNDIYCVKCKRKTPNGPLKGARSKNNRPMVVAPCTVCGTKKNQFVKESQMGQLAGEGILTNLLGIDKIPILSDLPLIGQLL